MQVAFQQADYVAWNVWAAINGRPLLPFKYQHLGDMMSLGAINGSVSLPVSVPGGLANSLQSGPVADLLKLAGVNIGGANNGAGITLDGVLNCLVVLPLSFIKDHPDMHTALE